MMTVNQLQMQNLAPRGIKGTCVPTSLCFITGASYYDVEEILMREQPRNYRPDIKGNGGVNTFGLLGKGRTLFGHRFTLVRQHNRRAETIADFRYENPTGTFLVCIHGHAFVIKDGVGFDLIETYWKNWLVAAWKVEKV